MMQLASTKEWRCPTTIASIRSCGDVAHSTVRRARRVPDQAEVGSDGPADVVVPHTSAFRIHGHNRVIQCDGARRLKDPAACTHAVDVQV